MDPEQPQDDPLRRWGDVPALELLPAKVVAELSITHPTLAPGFWEFRSLDCAPVVPAEPPAAVPTPVRFAWWRAVSAWVVLVAGYLLCIYLDAPWFVWILPVFGVLVAGWVTLRDQVRSMLVVFERAARGWALRDGQLGQGGVGSARNNGVRTRAAFDLRGLWCLRRDGTVVAPPDRRVLPPGWYPSPSAPMTLEAWSGSMWLEGEPVEVDVDHPAHEALARAWAERG